MWCFIEMHNQCSPTTDWEENLNSFHDRDGEDIFNEVVMDVGEEGGSVIASTTILCIPLRRLYNLNSRSYENLASQDNTPEVQKNKPQR